jgi:putative heme iron utilization protein
VTAINLAAEARQFLRVTRSGMLSTISVKYPGYPFGSVAPFVLDHSGQPIILISTIAEHTKNIIENPKVSLMMVSGDDDLQASARLTLVGVATAIDKTDLNLRDRYIRYFPQAKGYFSMHDFSFYRIVIEQARYIAGFGKMGWLASSEVAGSHLTLESKLASQEAAIIDHMNTDHVHSLIAYCKHYHNLDVTNPEMMGIDTEGFDLRVQITPMGELKIVRFNFDHPINDAQSARIALVAMSKVANL